MSGVIPASDNSLNVNFEFTDIGLGGKCPMKVTFDDGIPHNIKVELVLQNNTVAKEFGRTFGSNSFDAICADLIDAKLAVISMTTSWFTTSVEVAALDLNGSNGH